MNEKTHQEHLNHEYVGRIAVYVTETGLQEDGQIKAIYKDGTADIRLFVGGPSVVIKRGVPSRFCSAKAPHWWLKYRRSG